MRLPPLKTARRGGGGDGGLRNEASESAGRRMIVPRAGDAASAARWRARRWRRRMGLHLGLRRSGRASLAVEERAALLLTTPDGGAVALPGKVLGWTGRNVDLIERVGGRQRRPTTTKSNDSGRGHVGAKGRCLSPRRRPSCARSTPSTFGRSTPSPKGLERGRARAHARPARHNDRRRREGRRRARVRCDDTSKMYVGAPFWTSACTRTAMPPRTR